MNRIFIITGTRKGLGKQLAEYYLANDHIVVGCSRGPSSIIHSNYSHYVLDVTDEELIINMVRSVAELHGTIDVLINNAGIAAMNHMLTTPYENAAARLVSNPR